MEAIMRDMRVADGFRALKVPGMASEYERQELTPDERQLPMTERLLQMIHAEFDMRADRRTARLLAVSGLNPADSDDAAHPFRSEAAHHSEQFPPRGMSQIVVSYLSSFSGGQVAVFGLGLRMDSPFISSLWAL
jgi:hypothetical protein